ncbi:ribosome biogenesis protein tsr1 [Acarospora aff. strigata]|nr:ribosome biogenesis protein tsr1 [Acarospora aff. strigata]
MSKLDRHNQARQKQQVKHQENSKVTSIFSGQHSAPRIVAVVPLCPDSDARAAVCQLNKSLYLADNLPTEGLARVRVDRFKQSLAYVAVKRDLIAVLDACRVADFVVVILSATREVDTQGEHLLRCIEGQGVSNVITVVQGLDAIEPPKRRHQVATSLKSFITHFFPYQEKVFPLDSLQECSNIIRSLCTTTPKGVRWREDRSWLLVEDIEWPSAIEETSDEFGGVVLTGVVRGRGLKADRLVHLGDLGDFQIEKIMASPLPNAKKRQANDINVDIGREGKYLLEQATVDQDDLAGLAPEEITMADAEDLVSEVVPEKKGVLLDDHHYFSDDETHLPEAPKRLPKGTSSYQAAWYLGDISDSGSELDETEDRDGDLSMDQPVGPEDGIEGLDRATQREPTDGAPSEYPQSEMFLDPSPDEEEEQLAAYRSKRKSEAEEDLEFPDEIELHPNVLARERLGRYRGLKSLRTSHWDTDEDKPHEPDDWRRLLQIADYKGAKSQVLREALVGGVQPGTRVAVHLRNVPSSLRGNINLSRPLAMYSLLRHEHKRTVVNFSFTLSSDHPQPIKSKEELIMQCGPRRFTINPLFSQLGNTPNNVHKFDRYLHPGRTAMATFTAPLTWGSVPTLFFKRTTPTSSEADPDDISSDPTPSSTSTTNEQLLLIGTGTSQPPDPARVIAKRVILTGHPYKIHKKLVTVRYMFFNAEDVSWFKALQLWTKRGRSGYVKESLGTHGYFKATFDGKINPQDSVGVSLYKRVWPRGGRAWCEDGEAVMGS